MTVCVNPIGGGNIDCEALGPYAEVVSAIIFAVTIVFLVWDQHHQKQEMRLEALDLKYNIYNVLRDHHHDLIRLLIEEGEEVLHECFHKVEMPKEYVGRAEIELKKNETKIFSYYVAQLDLYERVFEAKEDTEIEDVDEYEYLTWLMYLEKMSHHWLFEYAFNQTRTIFDVRFMKDINSKIFKQKDAAKYILEEAERVYKKDNDEDLEIPDVASRSKIGN